MNKFFLLGLDLLAGLVLGAFFFGGLWWTVRKVLLVKSPAGWFFGSMLLRMSVTLAGFYWVGRGDWERLLACLLGFIVARGLVVGLNRRTTSQHRPAVKEASHAP